MASQGIPLIVGAGPVGLAAALYLARQGRVVRVVEMLDQPSTESRALAVNPRTLDLLEPTGVTRQLLEVGRPIYGLCLHTRESVVAEVPLAGIHPKYPFMLALSQASTERMLARALKAAGGSVERGVKLVDCRTAKDGVEAVLAPAAGGASETFPCPWMLAADGAHSVAREKLRMDFPGSSIPDEWHLADLPLKTRLSNDHGHVYLLDQGTFLFLLPVIDEALPKPADGEIWRVISNRAQPLSFLVDAEQAGPPVWESSFHVAHRMLTTMTAGAVYFAGDAAHAHSPIGARGMNLGIEDAWVFAELVHAGVMDRYDSLRLGVDRRVVRRVEFLTRMVAAASPLARTVREYAFPAAMRTPILRRRILAAVTGLDHDLPKIPQGH